MKLEQAVFTFGLTRVAAAEIVGLTDAQLKNHQQRYHIFPEKREGTGHTVTYDITDVVKLAAFCEMVECGFTAPAAAEALQDWPLFSRLFDGNGSFVLSLHEGRMVPIDGRMFASRFEIRVGVLFDRIWPKFSEVVLRANLNMPSEERLLALAAFEAWLSVKRCDRKA